MDHYPDTITIRRESSGAGEADPDYTGPALATAVPARIVPISGDETYRGRQLREKIDYVVRMQYFAGVTSDMRVEVDEGLHEGKLLNIKWEKAMSHGNGRPAKLELFCTETP